MPLIRTSLLYSTRINRATNNVKLIQCTTVYLRHYTKTTSQLYTHPLHLTFSTAPPHSSTRIHLIPVISLPEDDLCISKHVAALLTDVPRVMLSFYNT